jgi:hypothetical protein
VHIACNSSRDFALSLGVNFASSEENDDFIVGSTPEKYYVVEF